MKTQTFYLAYGSNLNVEQMNWRCPGADILGTSVINDYELVFRRGVLTIEPKEGACVPVGVWAIDMYDEAALDVYEGYPRMYRKEYMNVELDGETISALVYVMNEGRKIMPPSTTYFKTCVRGYRDFGFPTKPLVEKANEALHVARMNGDI